MAEANIAPITVNVNPQAEAIAGNSAAIFTATERKLIKEMAGEVDQKRSFKEIFAQKPLTPKVENEETTAKQEPDIKTLESQLKQHYRMLKDSPYKVPREHVEIGGNQPEEPEHEKDTHVPFPKNGATIPEIGKERPQVDLHQQTVAMAKELRLDSKDLLNKFSLQQKELHSLISRIKDLHLKRLLSETQEEFDRLSEKIRKETLASAKEAARPWLEAQLNNLSQGAAEYKLGVLKSLQSMDFNTQRKNSVKWLKKTIAKLSNQKITTKKTV
jgi:hypothetical protein